MVRRTLTEPKAAEAGVKHESSFARFRPSMAIFSKERALSCSLVRRGFSVMVEIQGSCGGTVRRGGCKGESET